MPATEVNKDLQNERKKCTFKNEEFTVWWVGGEAKLKEKRFRGKLHAWWGRARIIWWSTFDDDRGRRSLYDGILFILYYLVWWRCIALMSPTAGRLIGKCHEGQGGHLD